MKITEKTILIADTHYGENGIDKWQKHRKKLEKLNKLSFFELCNVAMLTKAISSDSTEVLHLGDYQEKAQEKYSAPITLELYLLKGNHDTSSDSLYKYLGLNVIKPKNNLFYQIATVNNIKIMFTHYPLFDNCEYDKKAKFYPQIKELEEIYLKESCNLNIHGHTHHRSSAFENGFNVGIDQTGLDLMNVGEVIKSWKKRIIDNT